MIWVATLLSFLPLFLKSLTVNAQCKLKKCIFDIVPWISPLHFVHIVHEYCHSAFFKYSHLWIPPLHFFHIFPENRLFIFSHCLWTVPLHFFTLFVNTASTFVHIYSHCSCIPPLHFFTFIHIVHEYRLCQHSVHEYRLCLLECSWIPPLPIECSWIPPLPIECSWIPPLPIECSWIPPLPRAISLSCGQTKNVRRRHQELEKRQNLDAKSFNAKIAQIAISQLRTQFLFFTCSYTVNILHLCSLKSVFWNTLLNTV
jgi:hypothetical protein